jgi:hypothetical protein
MRPVAQDPTIDTTYTGQAALAQTSGGSSTPL